MGDLIGGLIALIVMLLVIPIIVVVVLLALGIGIAAALIGIAIQLFFWALPFIVVFGLLWLIFRPSRTREVVRQ